ncbi:tyrosine-type recombinase/integrase [Asticcacaulis sp. DXS10W]|uniref:Tyrosine-type recombinase/integrase n=1 Tax=Asticcacaulis currens TaxID=2984210 RepID=A0ABT5IDL7_9CAUL|nr:tyrosine-type recombinase/integrase [Asticcacaulis currens]MDC7694279.1 tyrosine-type recombinase/integrase [Asticcacaulis currens]
MSVSEFDSQPHAIRFAIQLPPSVKYFDDLANRYRTILNLSQTDVWDLAVDGKTLRCNFNNSLAIDRPLLKRWLVDLLMDIKPVSASNYFQSVLSLGNGVVSDIINHLIEDHPSEFRIYWVTSLLPKMSLAQIRGLRSLCRTFCNHGYGQWSPDHLDFVSSLKGRPLDKYAVVRSGDCFVDLYQQSIVAQSLDDLAATVKGRGTNVHTTTLRGAIVLILAFQHGLRSGQIARIKNSGVKTFPTGAVHVQFPVTKQRQNASAEERLRSIRREWCPILLEYQKRRPANDNSTYFLGCTPDEVAAEFKKYLRSIGIEGRTLTDFRHTAGQRLADSGASHFAITEFMNHADLSTALVYIQSSPTQADRINKALGLSEIYSVVAQTSRIGILSREDLDNTAETNIISGTPHGVPITGIGACKSEVGVCSKSPVLSCYECHKFLALADTVVHEEVAANLRQIVLDFARMVRPGETSPAMGQLRTTLEAIELLIEQLQGGGVQ